MLKVGRPGPRAPLSLETAMGVSTEGNKVNKDSKFCSVSICGELTDGVNPRFLQIDVNASLFVAFLNFCKDNCRI